MEDFKNENSPTLSELAQANMASYNMSKNGTRNDRLDNVQKQAPDGYTVVSDFTDKMISTFRKETENPDDLTHFIITHRGSDFAGTQAKKDLLSDWNILTGNETTDYIHKRRGNKTKRAVNALKSQGDVYLTGHSLGGSTAYHALVQHPTLLESVKEVHLFNAGSSPFQEEQRAAIQGDVYKLLKKKVVHHSVKGDLVSNNAKKVFIGKHKSYKSSKKPTMSDKILKVISPLLGPWKLLLDAKTAVKDALGKHSIENFV